MKRRVLTAEEMQLWQSVTRHDRRIHHGYAAVLPVPSARPAAETARMDMPVWPEVMVSAPLVPGAYAGIDRGTADRFRRGELPIDGVADLHGMSREKAHHAVSHFIQAHYSRGSRCLLVITGKGTRNGQAERSGVLREALPAWLAEPALRPLVLAFDSARPRHGGAGAYYILLRRRR